MKQKVALIGTNGIPARYGGFETLTEFLALNLNKEHDLKVYCSGYRKNRNRRYLNSDLIYIPFNANGWQSLVYDALSIIHALTYCDTLVILGFSGVFAFPFKVFFRKKIVFNIGGIEWKKVRSNKFLGSLEILSKKVFERICVNFSDIVVADNKEILKYVLQNYKVNAELIEYGGDHATKIEIQKKYLKKYPFLNDNYDFSISRAQEDMNIHLLLDAYKKIKKRKLVIVSNWDTSKYGRELKNKYFNKYGNIYLIDSIYDLKILNMLRSNSSLYIHTHELCGTAPSLVEAMCLGLPIISFDAPTNRSTTENKALYFKSNESLYKLLKGLNNDEIKNIGFRMSLISKNRYAWSRIVNLYNNCIKK